MNEGLVPLATARARSGKALGLHPRLTGLRDLYNSGRLAIVQRAVQAHGGLVLVDSGPSLGTTFTIFLPAKMMAEDAA